MGGKLGALAPEAFADKGSIAKSQPAHKLAT